LTSCLRRHANILFAVLKEREIVKRNGFILMNGQNNKTGLLKTPDIISQDKRACTMQSDRQVLHGCNYEPARVYENTTDRKSL